MKDQVDGLRACGVAAAQLDSSLSAGERFAAEMDLRAGRHPPAVRLARTPRRRPTSTALLQQRRRPHLRHRRGPLHQPLGPRLPPRIPPAEPPPRVLPRRLRPRLHRHRHRAGPPRHRRRSSPCATPTVLVGNFDRPNLTYRVLPRHDLLQAGAARSSTATPARPASSTALRRSDVDELAASPAASSGVKALPYHAGLTDEQRQATQEEFAARALRRGRGHRRLRHGHRPLQRPLRAARRPCRSRWSTTSRRRAGPAATAWRPSASCSTPAATSSACKSMIEKSAAEAGADPTFLAGALRAPRRHGPLRPRRRLPAQGAGGVLRPGLRRPRRAAPATCAWATPRRCPTPAWWPRRSCRAWPASRRASASATSSASCAARTPTTSASAATTSSRPSACSRSTSKADVRDWIYQLIGQGVLRPDGRRVPAARSSTTRRGR